MEGKNSSYPFRMYTKTTFKLIYSASMFLCFWSCLDLLRLPDSQSHNFHFCSLTCIPVLKQNWSQFKTRFLPEQLQIPVDTALVPSEVYFLFSLFWISVETLSHGIETRCLQLQQKWFNFLWLARWTIKVH